MNATKGSFITIHNVVVVVDVDVAICGFSPSDSSVIESIFFEEHLLLYHSEMDDDDEGDDEASNESRTTLQPLGSFTVRISPESGTTDEEDRYRRLSVESDCSGVLPCGTRCGSRIEATLRLGGGMRTLEQRHEEFLRDPEVGDDEDDD